MYAIGNVIFGVPLTERIRKAVDSLCDSRFCADDPESFGFEELYSGSSDEMVGFCGVVLCRVNECENVRLKDLPAVTPHQIGEVRGMIDALPEPVRQACGDPDTWIVWSTS